MNILKRSKPALMLISALILGVISASVAKADQPWRNVVRDHADDMLHASIDIRKEILHVAPSSRLLGKMLTETGQMEANSAILKGWTYHRDSCYLLEQAEKIHENVHHLESLIAEAQVRSDHGLDRRMSCTDELRRMLQFMEDSVTHAIADIPQAHGHAIISPPVQYYNNRPYYGSSNFQYRDTSPRYGSPSIQFGVGPRLKINLNLGGSGRNQAHGGHSGHDHFQQKNKPSHDYGHAHRDSQNHSTHQKHQKQSQPVQRKSSPTVSGSFGHSGSHVGGGTNIYGGRKAVQQVADAQRKASSSPKVHVQAKSPQSHSKNNAPKSYSKKDRISGKRR